MAWEWGHNNWELDLANYSHLVSLFGLYFFLTHFYASELWASAAAIFVGFLKEIVDAVIPTSWQHFWAADGFSWANVVYGLVGWGFALLLDLVVPPHIRPKRKKEDKEDEEEE